MPTEVVMLQPSGEIIQVAISDDAAHAAQLLPYTPERYFLINEVTAASRRGPRNLTASSQSSRSDRTLSCSRWSAALRKGTGVGTPRHQ